MAEEKSPDARSLRTLSNKRNDVVDWIVLRSTPISTSAEGVVMRGWKHGFGILILMLWGAWTGCEILGTNPVGQPPVDARIVPPDSVEGIPLGASIQEVEAKLGAVEINGLGDGFFRNWYTANFFTSDSSSDGLTLYFVEEGVELGPLDAFSVRAPYDGKTKEGIGIDSSPASVLEAYGEPVRVDTSGRLRVSPTIRYLYCFSSGRHFIIKFRDDAVTGMGVGLFRPEPGRTPFCD